MICVKDARVAFAVTESALFRDAAGGTVRLAQALGGIVASIRLAEILAGSTACAVGLATGKPGVNPSPNGARGSANAHTG